MRLLCACFDEVHVIHRVSEAIDEVHRQPQAQPLSLVEGQGRLKPATDYTIRRPQPGLNLKAHPAFRIRESLREIFRSAPSPKGAEPPLDQWYGLALHCRLEPIKQMPDSPKSPKTTAILFSLI